MDSQIVSRFRRVCREAGARHTPSESLERLDALYSQTGRHYHSWRHVCSCLRELDGAWSHAVEPLALELALWFHDAVYVPGGADNERSSANLAADCLLAMGVPRRVVRAVERLVLCTDHASSPERSGADCALIRDVDLSILGSPRGEFGQYEQGIRLEYGHLEDTAYRSARGRFLREMLGRKCIYATEPFRLRCEAPARENLAALLRRLERG